MTAQPHAAATAGRRPATRPWFRSPDLLNYLFVLPAVLYIAVTMVYPIAYNLRMSFQDVTISTFLSGDAAWNGLDNYRTLFDDPGFWNALRLSFLFTFFSLVGQLAIGFALAVFFNQSFPGNGVLRAMLLVGWMLPTVISGGLFRFVLDGDFGILNYALQELSLIDRPQYWLTDPQTALAGVILANIWVGIPFNMVLLLSGLQGINRDLYEAASVDGATAWDRFRSITLPLMMPVALSVVLLGLIYTFKVFDLVFVMTAGGPVDATRVLPIEAYDQTFEFFNFSIGAATNTVILTLLLVVAGFYLWWTRREEAAI
jgi:multiple sugar transport system permease protein